MRKIIFLGVIVALTLSSCSFSGQKPADDAATDTTLSSSGDTTVNIQEKTGATYFVWYTLRDTDANGEVLDSNTQEGLTALDRYTEGMTLDPLEFTAGTNGVIPGFESAVADMQKGEKKTVTILPKDAYGEKTIEATVPKNSLAPEFEDNVSLDILKGIVTQTIDKSLLGSEGENLEVGKTISGGMGTTAVIKEINGNMVTLDIQNPASPFYGKDPKVGDTADQEGIIIKILDIQGDKVQVAITNKNSPFYGKEFKEGATAEVELEDGTGTITLKSFSGDSVVIDQPNTHPLAGKTLYFEIELNDVK